MEGACRESDVGKKREGRVYDATLSLFTHYTFHASR